MEYAKEIKYHEFEDIEWLNIADKLQSPHMKGLLTWLESQECDFDAPPSYFLAVDRWTLNIVDDKGEANDGRAEWFVASEEGGQYRDCSRIGMSDMDMTVRAWIMVLESV